MWIARDKDGSLKMFERQPIWDDENGDEIYSHWVSCGHIIPNSVCPELTFENSPIEVTVLPKCTKETLVTNPVYKAIYDLGFDEAINHSVFAKEHDNRYAEELSIPQTNIWCKNYGHPWCINCVYGCEDWHFDVMKYCKRK